MKELLKISKHLFLCIGLLCPSFTNANSLEFTSQSLPLDPTLDNLSRVLFIPQHPEYLLAYNDNGNISLINSALQTSSLLISTDDISNRLIRFTALTLHPNFAAIKKHGSLIFYSAHLESSASDVKKVKFQLDKNKTHPFEAVIYEWQLAMEEDKLTLVKEKKREVLRIPVPDSDTYIKSLSFNPYIKSWQKGFGHLFIITASNKHHANHAIFSGSLLRINPQQFGLRQYTVPHDNVLFNQTNLPHELVATGLGNIEHFAWVKNNENQYVYGEYLNTNIQIRKASLGDNFIAKQPEPENLLSLEKIDSNFIYARKSTLNNDNYPLVFLQKSDQHWLIKASPLSANVGSTTLASISFEQLSIDAKPQLLLNNAQNLTIVDLTSKIILKANNSTLTTPTTFVPVQNSNGVNLYLLVLVIIIGVLVLAVLFRQDEKYKDAKKLLRSHYASFSIDKKRASLLLFKRHEKTASDVVSIAKIVKSDIFLNDTLLNTVDPTSAFSNQQEAALNQAFQQEKRHKMIDNKVRKITLTLHLSDKSTKQLCLYLREGNQRLTKARFEQVQEQLIDWCWLISRQLCSTTEKRIIKPKVQPVVTKSTKVTTKVTPSAAEQQLQSPTATIKKKQESQDNTLNNKSDEELISSLNKLMELKSQGILSEEEFTSSKSRIIEQLYQK
ncbi:hypothetical protein [Thalassotalea sediminis]|uniref:hypothetical protein n=1 Tax=Thalassotalea sediminis TaxID=1759089 RepID=UPI002572DE49|nr:hypothetical protein [Thalassotalea sediminis]